MPHPTQKHTWSYRPRTSSFGPSSAAFEGSCSCLLPPCAFSLSRIGGLGSRNQEATFFFCKSFSSKGGKCSGKAWIPSLWATDLEEKWSEKVEPLEVLDLMCHFLGKTFGVCSLLNRILQYEATLSLLHQASHFLGTDRKLRESKGICKDRGQPCSLNWASSAFSFLKNRLIHLGRCSIFSLE